MLQKVILYLLRQEEIIDKAIFDVTSQLFNTPKQLQPPQLKKLRKNSNSPKKKLLTFDEFLKNN
jgi:hypothetical protein